jgi:hypothetical protein
MSKIRYFDKYTVQLAQKLAATSFISHTSNKGLNDFHNCGLSLDDGSKIVINSKLRNNSINTNF